MAKQNANWRDEKSLTDGFKRMLDNQVGCDVTFFVGPGRNKINAHKAVLIRCSDVFEAMFLGGLSQQSKDIELPDIDTDILMIFLDFVYDCEIKITNDNAAKLLYVAKKYNVEPLVCKIREFFNNLNPEKACAALDLGNLYDDEEMRTKALKYIEDNAEQCLKTDTFKALTPESIEIILQNDNLNVEETIVYTEVMSWAEQECARKEIAANDENKRSVLGQSLFLIRFPVMDMAFFAKTVVNTSLLNDKEKVSIFIHFFDRSPQCGCFDATPRRNQTVPEFPADPNGKCTSCTSTFPTTTLQCTSYTSTFPTTTLQCTSCTSTFPTTTLQCTSCTSTFPTTTLQAICPNCMNQVYLW